MGNSMPTEESGAPRVPEQSGTPMVPEESGAPSVPEQSGTPMVPEESGTTSVPEGAGVSTVQDVGTASVPEGAGVAVGQERSESEADSVLGHSPSYADHVQGPATPPSVPSLGPERFSPSPAEEGRPGGDIGAVSAQAEHAEDEAWGEWQAAPDAPSAPAVQPQDAPSAPASQPVGVEDREPKRPRKGLPSGSTVQMSAVPLPGEAEESLLRQLFMKEQERRIQEALSLGIHLRAAPGEPLPLLSHVHGRPSNPEDIYDSLSQALTIRDRSFLTRVSLGQGASSRYLPGGSSSVYGLNRLERPEEMLSPTPVPPKVAMYPEPEERPKLMVDASTITDNAASEWSEWLRSARQGRSLREWGILAEDLVTGDGHPVFIGGTPGGYKGWQMEQCWATQVGGPECARDAGIFERGTSVRRQFQQGAYGLQQPASRPCGSCSRAPSKRLSGRRGRILEVHSSHHGCSCTTASRQKASEKSSRHGDYCGLPPNRKVCPSTSTCCSIPHDTGRKRRQQWIGFLRNFWGIRPKPKAKKTRDTPSTPSVLQFFRKQG